MTETDHASMPQQYAFAGYRLDAAARSLTRAGEPVAIRPKSLDCLIYLIEHRSRAVGRDELISAVWGRVDLSYAVLAQTLWKLRRALGEAQQTDSQFIRTVPRFGYQWVASVDAPDAIPATLESAASNEVVVAPHARENKTVVEAPRARSRANVLRGIAVVVCAIGLLTIAALWRHTHTLAVTANDDAAVSQASAKRFLVLPVAIDANRGEDAWVRLGVMDYIATQLRANDKIQVIGSDRVVALLSGNPTFDADDASQLAQLKLVSDASYIVAPRASRIDVGWKLSMAVHTAEGSRVIEAAAASPLEAANQVISEALRDAGVDATLAIAAPTRLTELLQRVDAASLAGNYAQALDIARSADAEQKSDAQLQLKIAQTQFHAGQIDAAAADFRALVDSTREVPRKVRITAKLGLAAVAERQHRYLDAESGCSEVIKALGEYGDSRLLSHAYSLRGLVNNYLGNVDRGLADFAQARIAFTRSGDQAGLGSLDTTIGLAERERGHYREAADAFDRAIAILDRFNMHDRTATALIGAIGVRLEILDIPRALTLSERADALSSKLESPLLINYLALVRGETLLADGQLREVNALLDELGAAADAQNPASVPDLLLLRVSLGVNENKVDMSKQRAALLLDRIEHPADPIYRTSLGGAIMVMVDGALRAGDTTLASELLEHLRQATETDIDRLRPLALELVQAQILSASSDATADAHFAAALAEVDRVSYPDALVTVCSEWARHLQGGQDRTTMTMVAGRLQPFVERDYRAARAVAALYSALGEQDSAARASTAAQTLAHERSLTAPW